MTLFAEVCLGDALLYIYIYILTKLYKLFMPDNLFVAAEQRILVYKYYLA